MKICPNCGKEVSETSIHCGHCGHRLQVEQKKTMIGMGAVDPAWREQLEQAREQAGGGDGEQAEAPVPTLEMEDSDAPTQMMDAVPGQDEESPSPVAGEAAFAPTEIHHNLKERATGVTEAAESPAVEKPNDEGVAPGNVTGPQAFAATEAHEQVTIPPGPDGTFGGQTEPTAAPDFSSEGPGGTDLEAGPDQKEEWSTPGTNLEGFGDDVSTSSTALAATEEDSLVEGEEKEGKSRTMLIVGGIIGLLFFCCLISAVIYFAMSFL